MHICVIPFLQFLLETRGINYWCRATVELTYVHNCLTFSLQRFLWFPGQEVCLFRIKVVGHNQLWFEGSEILRLNASIETSQPTTTTFTHQMSNKAWHIWSWKQPKPACFLFQSFPFAAVYICCAWRHFCLEWTLMVNADSDYLTAP